MIDGLTPSGSSPVNLFAALDKKERRPARRPARHETRAATITGQTLG
jgi:hypothetical protein